MQISAAMCALVGFLSTTALAAPTDSGVTLEVRSACTEACGGPLTPGYFTCIGDCLKKEREAEAEAKKNKDE